MVDIYEVKAPPFYVNDDIPAVWDYAKGVIKVPYGFTQYKQPQRKFVVLVLDVDEHHGGPSIIFMNEYTVNTSYLSEKTHNVRARSTAIPIIKMAIRNTWKQWEPIRGVNPVYGHIRKLFFDAITRTHMYMVELMEQEATERQMVLAAAKIQSVFRDVVSDPNHPMCKRRLMHEFNEIIQPLEDQNRTRWLIGVSNIVVLSATCGFVTTINLWFFNLLGLFRPTKIGWPVLVIQDGQSNLPNIDSSVMVPVPCLERSLWSATLHTLLQPTDNLSFRIKNVLLFIPTMMTTLCRVVFIDWYQSATVPIAPQYPHHNLLFPRCRDSTMAFFFLPFFSCRFNLRISNRQDQLFASVLSKS
jgi:hypothetical protein